MLPLTGVKVVEFANNIAGPYAGYILAMLGADVLKIERPEGGDDARAWGPPFWKDTSATFQCLNVNKKGITLDLKSADDIAWVKDYIESCDVLIHNLRPGVMDSLGLGSVALRERNPRLVYCSLSAFGPKGPMQKNGGYEPMVQAFSGLFSVNGYPDRPGVRIGTSVLDLGSAVWAALGCVTGVLQRERTGQGCVVDASLYETALGLLTVHFARLPGRRPVARAAPERQPGCGPVPGHRLRRRPGDRRRRQRSVVGQILRRTRPSRMGAGPPLQDQRRPTRQQGSPCRYGNARSCFRSRARSGCTRLQRAGVPCAPINDLTHMKSNAQTAALEMVQRVPDIDLDLMALPLTFGGERPRIRTRAPKLGEHNRAIRGLPRARLRQG